MKSAYLILILFLFIGCSSKKDFSNQNKSNNNIPSMIFFNDSLLLIKSDKIELWKDNAKEFTKNFGSKISTFVKDKGSNVFLGFEDGKILYVKEDKSFDETENFFEPIKLLKLSEDFQFLIAVSVNNKIIIVDRTTKNMGMGSYDENIVDIKISGDNRQLSIQFEKKIVILDFIDKKELGTIQITE
ncbi:MAG TPA: hypothetical protein PLO89_11935 [Spirochaetota bacterium]|nr:hypothetical protein [Spirochaetota bacterium]